MATAPKINNVPVTVGGVTTAIVGNCIGCGLAIDNMKTGYRSDGIHVWHALPACESIAQSNGYTT